MYFRRVFGDKKTKLAYSNGLSQLHLSSAFSSGGKRTAHKTCLKLSIKTQKSAGWQKKLLQLILQNGNSKTSIRKGGKADIATRTVQQSQINPKYNKNRTLITSLSSLHIRKQYEIPKII